MQSWFIVGCCNNVIAMFFRIGTAINLVVLASCVNGIFQTIQKIEIKASSELSFIKDHYRKRKKSDSIAVKK